MLTRLLFMVALVGCGIVVLTGAWPSSPSRSSPSYHAAFVPKALELDAEIVGAGIDAEHLLDRAIVKLDKADWLHTKIHQVMHGPDAGFVAHGFLQRGPNQCARLELEIVRRALRTQVLLVSDGESVAHVERLPGAKPSAAIAPLPALAEGHAVREAFLAGRGGGGPVSLLQHIRHHVRNARLLTGLCDGAAVIQVQGSLDPALTPAFSALNLATLDVCVYLDAKTLWPRRIEWSGAGPRRPAGPLLDIDFLAPSVGIPQSDDECARLFSYHPDGSESVSEIPHP
jgi:hypothetical protein